MALRNIIKEGDETLTKKSRQVTEFDKKLQILIKDMKDTLKKADGLGLAAPQVGILRRVVIILDEDGKTMLTLVNPEIIDSKGEQEATEGCLSVPGIFGQTKRPAEVTVKALNEKGKEIIFTRTGITAVCCCHEIDHLDGILFREHVEKYLDSED
ncbi:MAG: peptide deformylase [Clostridiales bacterium]|nr:MAG: peptide deformylase [Clostridiales bacterium]